MPRVGERPRGQARGRARGRLGCPRSSTLGELDLPGARRRGRARDVRGRAAHAVAARLLEQRRQPRQAGPGAGGARRARRAALRPMPVATRAKSSTAASSSASASAQRAAPEMDGAVLRPAEREHVAAAVALGEVGDPVAPRRRALEVEHRGARGDEEAARPRRSRSGSRPRPPARPRVASSRQPHALGRRAAHADERRALEREPEHLEVGDVEPPPELGGALSELARRRRCRRSRARRTPRGRRASRAPGTGSSGSSSRCARRSQPLRHGHARRGSRARRPRARSPCAPLRRRRRAGGRAGRRARGRANTAAASSSHHAAQLAPSRASGVSAMASESSNDARAACQRPARSASQPAVAGSAIGAHSPAPSLQDALQICYIAKLR